MRKFVDAGELDRFVAKLYEAAGGGMRRGIAKIMEEIALEFLDAVFNEVIAVGSFDTGRLHNSFSCGGVDNVYIIGDAGLELEVGTNVEYADWVNTGHFQMPGRFIPGRWAGDKFIYEPGAKTGMVLKASWVEGTHYYDDAYRTFGAQYPVKIRTLLNDALDRLFGG